MPGDKTLKSYRKRRRAWARSPPTCAIHSNAPRTVKTEAFKLLVSREGRHGLFIMVKKMVLNEVYSQHRLVKAELNAPLSYAISTALT